MVLTYTIYGERHSGTKFLDKLISTTFDIQKSTLFEHKHFFTPKHILSQNIDIISSNLFFCIARNPYDWILSFHNERHHCGIIGSNDIYKFMSKEWISREPFLGPEILSDRHLYNKQRYQNIFHMRAAKLEFLYHLLPRYVNHYVMVKYEDFLNAAYSNQLINILENNFQLKKRANTDQVDFINKRYYYNRLNTQLLNYMNHHIFWTIENQLGYIKANTVAELSNT